MQRCDPKDLEVLDVQQPQLVDACYTTEGNVRLKWDQHMNQVSAEFLKHNSNLSLVSANDNVFLVANNLTGDWGKQSLHLSEGAFVTAGGVATPRSLVELEACPYVSSPSKPTEGDRIDSTDGRTLSAFAVVACIAMVLACVCLGLRIPCSDKHIMQTEVELDGELDVTEATAVYPRLKYTSTMLRHPKRCFGLLMGFYLVVLCLVTTTTRPKVDTGIQGFFVDHPTRDHQRVVDTISSITTDPDYNPSSNRRAQQQSVVTWKLWIFYSYSGAGQNWTGFLHAHSHT